MKILAIVICVLGLVLRLHGQGYILPDGIVYLGLDFNGGYSIDVRQNSTNTGFVDYTGFSLKPVGKTAPNLPYSNIFSSSVIVNEGVRIFLVPSNAPITLEPILSQSWLEIGNTPNNIFTNQVPFYLALYTGYNPFLITNINGTITGIYTGIYQEPVFGWVKLVNNLGVIQLLDGAMEYGGAGIYTGTQNIIPVPEPDGLTLEICLGAMILILYRKIIPQVSRE